MKVVKETCIAGMTIDVSVRVSSGNHSNSRKKRMNITREAVQKNNDRIAAKNLSRLLNANFEPGDFHLTLSYKNAPTKEEAKKDREKFIRSLRKEMKLLGRELKYIAVTEFENVRIHHHLIINKVDIDILRKLWTKGWFEPKSLDPTGNWQQLAEYLIKETTKTFRDETSLYGRRYSCSTNLVKPVPKVEEVSVSDLFEEPEPIKGYYIPKDSIRRYQHPITGIEYQEWTNVALEKPMRFKVWPRGKKAKKEYYKVNYEEEQVSIDTLLAWEEI